MLVMNVNAKYLFFLPIFLFYFWSNALPLFVRSSITPVSKNNNTLQCLANELHLLYQDIDKSLFEEHENFEDSLTSYLKRGSKNYFHSSATLPVVVHIVHENGIENLTNEEVEMGLERLNDAFNNRNYYNGGVGVNPDISFCLAQRTPQGLTTNGEKIIKTENVLVIR